MNYMQNQYQGNFRPVRKPMFRNPPVFEKYITIGTGKESGDYGRMATMKLYVQSPTIEYPNVAVKLTLMNGMSSTFQSLTMQDLDEICSFLQNCKPQLIAVLAQLAPITNELIEKRKQADEIQNQAQQDPKMAAFLQALQATQEQ